ncbi:MAG: DEAD/DEAH box helicase [Candidatus Marinimicrobia bacterium]|nr:DEAD/DEAH box helicase [Candidatus Neomarinimicrobiota bacterium]
MKKKLDALPKGMLKALGLDNFIAFDVETTGLESDMHDIIQFSASRFINGKLDKTYHFFCNPGYSIPEHITELTRITDEMVAESVPFIERVEDVREFFGDLPLVGHNVKFDLKFIAKYGIEPDNPILDTLELSRIYMYYLVDRKLETLADLFRLQTEGAHRANVDTENTGNLLLELLKIMWYYDYSLITQICFIIEPLVREPNHTLYMDLKAWYEAENRTKPEKNPSLTHLGVNIYGDFKNTKRPDEGNATEKLQRVNSKDIQEVFGYKGLLETSLDNYEMRLGQVQLSADITEAFNKGKFLVAEAGTGVGKSLAYLIPAMKWVQKNREGCYSAVISSNTKALQEQLFYKDIPFVYENIDKDFTSVLLKGRNNYICLTKWEGLLKNMDSALSLFDRTSLLPITLWLRETKTGDIEENSGFRTFFHSTIWAKIASEPGYCTTKKCAAHNGCYLGKVRRLSQVADIVVVNHSLLLSDAASDNQILPDFPILIIDEAHNLEKSAYQYFAKEFGPWIGDQVSDKLYFSGRDNFGTLVALNRKVGGKKWNDEHSKNLLEQIQKAEKHIKNFQAASKNFFNALLDYANLNMRKSIQKYVQKVRYLPENHLFGHLDQTAKLFEIHVEVMAELKVLQESLKNLDTIELEDIKLESEDVMTAIADFYELGQTIKFLLEPSDSAWVYWIELPVDLKNSNIKIVATPLDVAADIYEKILKTKHSVIATSATMSIDHSFDYFTTRAGFNRIKNDQLITAEYESPFDFNKQAASWVLTFLPEPSDRDFDKQVAELMNEIAARYKRGTLLLTTSYQSIRNLRMNMEPAYTKASVPLLYQSGAASRTALIHKFRQKKNATLIGTESFWEGVDVPGEALEILAMLKLPFAVPSEPVVSAISDSYRAEGRNAFLEYNVPEAVLKFKQGFGRLIRSKRDTGIALFFDRRLSFKRYGQSFLNSLPHKPWFVKSKEELFKNLDGWFKK